MLQIISNSNETSTGPELVQNGNFSEIGADVVTNGDFSAVGSNLVTNPNFTNTGSELVVNGNFLSATSWNVNLNWNINTALGVAEADGTSDGDINQSVWLPVIGKSYKVIFEVVSRSQGEVLFKLGGVSGQAHTTIGIKTEYIVATSTDRLKVDSQSSFIGSVKDVSVKELGEDWANIEDTISFNENGLKIETTSGLDVKAYNNASTLVDNKSFKVTYTIYENGLTGTNSIQYYTGSTLGYQDLPQQGVGTHTFYYTKSLGNTNWYFRLNLAGGSTSTTDFVTISSISVQELGEGWTVTNADATHYVEFIETGARFVLASTSPLVELKQTTFELLANKSYKLNVDMTRVSGSIKVDTSGVSELFDATTSGDNNTRFVTPTANMYLSFYRQSTPTDITLHSVSVQQLDPNDYWTIGSKWSIDALGARLVSSDSTASALFQDNVFQIDKSYKVEIDAVVTSGSAKLEASGGSTQILIDTTKTYLEDIKATRTNVYFNRVSSVSDINIESISVKLLGSYSDQSIYVTAADVQTIAQADVYYLVELTSMGSKNSLYFLPSSVVANNGRYTKLNFTVVSKDATPTPASGIISFYDSVGGFDTYPMGFYEFRIYEQTSSTNLDPLLATGLLEKGFAFVRDFSGNMQELTDGFKEYDSTLTQYVYSK